MGRAPAWTQKEQEVASIAWVRATNNGIEGVDQCSADFRNKVHRFVQIYAPFDSQPDRFAARSLKTVYKFLRDTIFPDIESG